MSIRAIAWALQVRTGSPTTKLVLIKLADNANDDGVCWPSMSHIARHTELSRSTVVRHIAALEAAGLVIVTRRSQDGVQLPSHYKLVMMPNQMGSAALALPSTEKQDGGARVALGVVAERATKPPVEPSVEPSPTTTPSPPQILCSASINHGGGGERDEYIRLAVAQPGTRDPVGFAVYLMRRLDDQGNLSQADMAQLDQWRRAEHERQQMAVRRQGTQEVMDRQNVLLEEETQPRIWKDAIGLLADTIPRSEYDLWIRPLRCILVEAQKVELVAPDPYLRSWVIAHYLTRITEAVRAAGASEAVVSFVK
jgi:DNA-binding transcriptional ArsR family regulator